MRSAALISLLLTVACAPPGMPDMPPAQPPADEPETLTNVGNAVSIDADGCPTLLDISTQAGAGSAYPDPWVNVSCSGSTVTIQANGIPHYPFVAITPNGLAARDVTIRLPQSPQMAANPTDIPLLGIAGISVTGMVFFGPNEAARPDPYGDPVANRIMDSCAGHTSPGGQYHFHALLEECLRLDPVDRTAPSPILGFALDGFPIYGPRGCVDTDCSEIVTFRSGWQQQAAGNVDCTSAGDCGSDETCALSMIDGVEKMACVPKTYAWDNHGYRAGGADVLDECNGRIGPDGSYRYHTTATFPYVIACYRGTPL